MRHKMSPDIKSLLKLLDVNEIQTFLLKVWNFGLCAFVHVGGCEGVWVQQAKPLVWSGMTVKA